MKVNLSPILGNHTKKEALPVDSLLDLSGQDIKHYAKFFKNPIKINGSVKNDFGMITLKYTVSFSYTDSCISCLKQINIDKETEFVHNLKISRDLDAGDFGSEVIVTGEELDLGKIVLEDIILTCETDLLCKEDCKGLCPKCGTDLNEHTCSCIQKEVDPRFAVLLDYMD